MAANSLNIKPRVVEELATWPTEVDVRVVTEKPERLQQTFIAWQLPASFTAAGPIHELPHPFELAWVHRDLMQAALATGQYTAFIYLEDDMRLTWDSLISWATDQAVLEPLGFQRQFYRTEIAPWDGKQWLFDALQHVHLATYERKLDVGVQTRAHQHYIQLPEPYSAVFVASPTLLARFIKSPFWSKRVGVHRALHDLVYAT
ncbi:hypothetical protein WJX74_003824 [Apatococcus lobatus]|uniref:Uncharacterized protein n=1 Tax=Apatococcus lobatus TaxID=904363 RepID=A0AAW1RXY6_9CHLO